MESKQEIVNFIDKTFQDIGSSLSPLELPSSILHSKGIRDHKVEPDGFQSCFEHSSYHTREFNVKAHGVPPLQHHHLHTDKLASELIPFANKHPIDHTGATRNAGATGNSGAIRAPLWHEKATTTACRPHVGELRGVYEWKNVSDGVKHLGEKEKKQGHGQGVKEEKGEGRMESNSGSEGQDEDSKGYVHVIYAKSSGYCNQKVKDELPNVISTRESSPQSSSPKNATLSEKEEPSYEDDFIIIEHEK
ncbi:uncharacterized protein LAJ45_06520 [Morchella importuna]|uniref:uncharacterized protein n=1 Tax=Morchella importuna TaxID=1174673 RepID=UPI001E8E0743|nr:uncharacterized protein LAJ45_06520 [Morchella importuna]KAH8149441.1 hypothetical protein LAJ45_06520 [Morchella importuna]